MLAFSHKESTHLIDFLKENSQTNLFRTRSGHALEALLVCLVYLGDLKLVFLQLVDQLGGVELAVAPTGFDDLGLLIQREVLPCEVWADILLKQGQDLIVGDGAGVREVIDASVLVLCHKDGGGKEIVQDGIRIGNVYHTLVLGDFGHKVTGVKIIADGHSESKNEHIGVCLHNLCHS
jgi:hypothetical protein